MKYEPKQAIRDMVEVHGQNGNWNNDPYMHGLYNGLEFALSIVESREAKFRDAPKKWGSKPEQIVRPILKLVYFLEREYYKYFGSNKLTEEK